MLSGYRLVRVVYCPARQARMSDDEKPTDKETKPFEHYCPCGAWGSFGFGVNVREGKEGVWRCFEHKDWWR